MVECTLDNFEELITQQPTLLLACLSSSSAPCALFRTVFVSVAEQNPSLVFATIDVEAQKELTEALGINAVPTVLLFRESVLLYRFEGALPASALETMLAKARTFSKKDLPARALTASEGDV